LRENITMLEMCRDMGFDIRADLDDPDLKVVTLPLKDAGAR
jgi:acetyltransferase